MKRLALVVLVVLVSACATYPPPKIEGNRYQNYRLRFTLELPGEPWEPTDKWPAWFKRYLLDKGRLSSGIQLKLFNNQNNAFIIMSCSKLPGHTGYAFEMFNKEHFERKKKESLKSQKITRFDYNLDCSYLSSCYWSVEIDGESEIQKIQAIIKGNLYSLDRDNLFIEISLVSDRLTFAENLKTFKKLVNSLDRSPPLE